MDLSNKEESKYWFQQAREVEDEDLRKIAMKACDHYHSLAVKQERIVLRRARPGYGFRSLLGFFCVAALLVLWCLLAFAKTFSVGALVSAGGVLIGLMIVGSAFASHSTGRLSDDSLVRLIHLGVKSVLPEKTSSTEAPTIDGKAAPHDEQNRALPHPQEDRSLPPPF